MGTNSSQNFLSIWDAREPLHLIISGRVPGGWVAIHGHFPPFLYLLVSMTVLTKVEHGYSLLIEMHGFWYYKIKLLPFLSQDQPWILIEKKFVSWYGNQLVMTSLLLIRIVLPPLLTNWPPLFKCVHCLMPTESKPILGMLILSYLLPDTRVKADHTKFVTFVGVRFQFNTLWSEETD